MVDEDVTSEGAGSVGMGLGFRGRIVADRYVIGREIGRGAMGVVCEGFDGRLERKVAVKLLEPSAARSASAIKRFQREALAAGRIGHQNICDVRDRGLTAEGLPFIVMELLEGRPLSRLIEDEGHLAPARAVRLVLQILAALEAAHGAGIVHRDLKPAHVFVARDSVGDERVKLLDFGISHFEPETGAPEVTVTGAVLGTPRYMSPEQARGKEVDQRTDLWSVGVVLYECLTGRPAFDGGNYNELMFSIAQDEPARPTTIVPGLPSALEAVVERAMAKDPRDRFSSAGEMSGALATAARGLSTEPLPLSSPTGLRAASPRRSTPEAVTLVGDDPPDEGRDAWELGPRGVEEEPVAAVPAASPLPTDRRRLVLTAALVLGVLTVAGVAAALATGRADRVSGQESAVTPRDGHDVAHRASSAAASGAGPGQAADSAVAGATVEVLLRGMPTGGVATFSGEPVVDGVLRGLAGTTGSLTVAVPGGDALEREVTLAEGLVVDLALDRPERAVVRPGATGFAPPSLGKDGGERPRGTRPSSREAPFVHGRLGTKVTVEYGDE